MPGVRLDFLTGPGLQGGSYVGLCTWRMEHWGNAGPSQIISLQEKVAEWPLSSQDGAQIQEGGGPRDEGPYLLLIDPAWSGTWFETSGLVMSLRHQLRVTLTKGTLLEGCLEHDLKDRRLGSS